VARPRELSTANESRSVTMRVWAGDQTLLMLRHSSRMRKLIDST
jgi:hypothetical protein